jgi:hypothetical protein
MPYRETAAWRSRAQWLERYAGQTVESIVTYQIAAESLLWETWRMLMVDDGASSSEIVLLAAKDIPFKQLLTKELPAKLGGSWDVTRSASKIGCYWQNLYQVRNQIVHGGFEPPELAANLAHMGYRALRDHLEARLRAKCRAYPRTLLARVGEKQLKERGWMTHWMQAFTETAKEEPRPYWLPRDLAGR